MSQDINQALETLKNNPNPSELKNVYNQLGQFLGEKFEYDYSRLPEGYNYPPEEKPASASSLRSVDPMKIPSQRQLNPGMFEETLNLDKVSKANLLN